MKIKSTRPRLIIKVHTIRVTKVPNLSKITPMNKKATFIETAASVFKLLKPDCTELGLTGVHTDLGIKLDL